MAYKMTRESLLLDLYAAYACAKRHKASKPYVRFFRKHLDENLRKLRDELMERTYKPEPSTCFIVERPKKREVFAAQFRDRVVHHLYYNYTHILFERTFIEDSYSCIPGRGTHYGVKRLEMHIRQESRNYSRKCYALKLDKRGYFMHINRHRLYEITIGTLRRMATHRISEGGREQWRDVLDMDFLGWLSREIVMLNPKDGCHIVGSVRSWDGLDHSRSLFYTDEGCGLPIGNLTSQLLSNVYLNDFDQYMKRDLKCKHYGRYVDDSYVISTDRDWLLGLVPRIRTFLKERLGLDLHMGKLHVVDVSMGVEFLGAYVRNFRTYISRASVGRTVNSISTMSIADKEKAWRSINSFLGMMAHYSSYFVRSRVFLRQRFLQIASFDKDVVRMNKPILLTI
jgi:retron-type reverse transcriptase